MTPKCTPYHVTLIGCGKMGSAMLRSWLKNDLISHIDVIDPSLLSDDLQQQKIVNHTPYYNGEIIHSDILILAVKPQILKEAATSLAQNLSPKTVILSIAAGQSLSTLGQIFGSHAPLIRAMPNTPAAIGKGMSVAIPNEFVTKDQRNIAERILSASGLCEWIDDEALMDAVTALSGSGPAYVFYLIEAMAKAGETLGLSTEMAMTLARQTVIGSAALAENEPETAASTLRKNVTSPNGTTQAALEILMNGKLQECLNAALTAARDRGQELNH